MIDCTPEIVRQNTVFLASVFLLRRAIREWKQPKKERCVTANKAERNWRCEEHFDVRHGDAGCGVQPAGFQSRFGPVFPAMLSFLPFGMGCLSCATVCWRYVICFFSLIHMGITVKRLPTISEVFGLLNRVETVTD